LLEKEWPVSDFLFEEERTFERGRVSEKKTCEREKENVSSL